MWEPLLDFFFPRRLGRLNYFVRVLLWNVVTYPLLQDLTFNPQAMAPLAILQLALLTIYGVWFIYLARVRDSGMPQWSLVCIFIPVVSFLYSILLLFRPSWTPLDEAQAHPQPDESQIFRPRASSEATPPIAGDPPPEK
jgi:hypothetical protein